MRGEVERRCIGSYAAWGIYIAACNRRGGLERRVASNLHVIADAEALNVTSRAATDDRTRLNPIGKAETGLDVSPDRRMIPTGQVVEVCGVSVGEDVGRNMPCATPGKPLPGMTTPFSCVPPVMNPVVGSVGGCRRVVVGGVEERLITPYGVIGVLTL